MLVSRVKGMGRRVALLGVLSALMLAVGASAASASVVVSPGGPYNATQTVTVSGTPKAEATHVAIVACNVSAGEEFWGTRCDINSATPGFKTVADYAGGVKITIDRGSWQDYDFTTGTPTPVEESETTCLNVASEGEQCAVVVSYYKVEGKLVTQLGAEAANVLFK
jgi:hypothetical protein